MIPVHSTLRNPAAVLLFSGLLLASGLLPAPVAAAGKNLDEAVRLYDAGRYAEAAPLLERVVAAGDADGITHYRLYFCQLAMGDPRHPESLALARTRLERDIGKAKGFEVAFYLSNAYANLGLTDQVARVATEVTDRFVAGKIAPPKEAAEQFRLGKLFVDRAREADAASWFEKAVDGFARGGDTAHRPYLEWAARWLGRRAMAEERFEEAATNFAHVCAGNRGTLEDVDALALANLMIGEYTLASKTWQRAVRMNPGQGDRYRYGSGLAQLALTTPEIPISPDGERAWHEPGPEELEEILRRQTQLVREAKQEWEGSEEPAPERLRELNERIAAARPLFVAAALEYVRRGLNLREAAFFGGYAPLVFHAKEWQIDPPESTGGITTLTRSPEHVPYHKALEEQARKRQEYLKALERD